MNESPHNELYSAVHIKFYLESTQRGQYPAHGPGTDEAIDRTLTWEYGDPPAAVATN